MFWLTFSWVVNHNPPPDLPNGTPLALLSVMGCICQHCDAPFVGPPYRVKSEESGIVLLDLIVCHRCYVQAQELGLHTEKIEIQLFPLTGLPSVDQKKA